MWLCLCAAVSVLARCVSYPSINCAGIAGAPGAGSSRRQDSDERAPLRGINASEARLYEAVFSAARRRLVGSRRLDSGSAASRAPRSRGGEVALICGSRPFSFLWVSLGLSGLEAVGSGLSSRLWERTMLRHIKSTEWIALFSQLVGKGAVWETGVRSVTRGAFLRPLCVLSSTLWTLGFG